MTFRRAPFASKNLRLHGDSQAVVQWVFLILALLFWVMAKWSDDPIMPPEVYGVLATSVDAEFWAASLMLASGVFLLGVEINGRWIWSPGLRLIGAAWHVATLSAFAFSARDASYGDFLVLAAGVFAGLHGWFAALNIADLRAALRGQA